MILKKLPLLFFVIGCLLASAFGYVMDVYRINVAMPFILSGGVCLLVNERKQFPKDFLLLVLSLGSLYFLLRILFSPVPDFRDEELALMISFLVSFFFGWLASSRDFDRKILCAVFLIVFVLHFFSGLYQEFSKPEWAFFNTPRDNNGISGLYWHRNYLAGFLEFFLPAALSIALFSKRIFLRGLLGVFFSFGLCLLIMSSSRGGILASLIGCLSVFLVWCLIWIRHSRFPWLSVGLTVLVLSVSCLVGKLAFGKISDNRGRTTNISSLFAEDDRIFLFSMAIEQWAESPIFGWGSRSYDYWSDQNWHASVFEKRQGKRAVMAHNDYLQTLAEYGIIGVGFVMLFVFASLFKLLSKLIYLTGLNHNKREEYHLPLIGMVSAFGALAAAMVHSLIDFNLHIQPNLMFFSGLLGFGLSSSIMVNRKVSLNVSGYWVLGASLLMLCISLCFLGRYWISIPKWFSWEKERIVANSGSRVSMVKGYELFDSTPTSSLGRHLIDAEESFLIAEEDNQLRSTRAKRMIDLMDRMIERNPYDGFTWGSYAPAISIVKGSREKIEEAGLMNLFLKGRREHAYGGMWYFGELQNNLAIKAWKNRKPDEALMRFVVAKEYMDFSRKIGYRKITRDRRKYADQIADQIDFLTGAGITAASRDYIPSPRDFYDVNTDLFKIAIWRWDVENR